MLSCRDLTVDPRGLRVRGARIIVDVDLNYVAFSRTAELTECYIGGTISMDYPALKALWLTGTHMRGLSLDGAEISGGLLADRSGLVDMRTAYHEQLSAVIHPIEGTNDVRQITA